MSKMPSSVSPAEKTPAKNLPMPRYEYQTPKPGSFVAKSTNSKEPAKEGTPAKVDLQNVRFG